MSKTDGYTTLISVDDKLLEVTVKVLPQKANEASRWENVCQWGQDFAKRKKISSNKIDKVIAKRRYGKD